MKVTLVSTIKKYIEVLCPNCFRLTMALAGQVNSCMFCQAKFTVEDDE